MISKEEVEHIAKLARLGLSEDETEKVKKDLSQILDYIDLLNELDVSGVEPVFHPTALKNVMREDKAIETKDVDEIIKQFPNKQGKFVKVKKIFN